MLVKPHDIEKDGEIMKHMVRGTQLTTRNLIGGTVITDLYEYDDGRYKAYSTNAQEKRKNV